MTYFELYGLPVSFKVDTSALRRLYYQNSKKYHPDYHTQSTSEQQADMLDLSTLNNEAYKTLADQDMLIRYVLELKGLLGDENMRNALPQSFLMDMMDINEALMDLEMEPDADKLRQTAATVRQMQEDLRTGVAPLLEQYTDDENGVALLPAIREYFYKRKYLLRIQENLSTFAPTS